jgi:hypothetical protein
MKQAKRPDGHVGPVDPTSAERQARMRAKLGAPVKAYLDPDLRERLERCAARKQTTLAHLLRTALEQFLEFEEESARRPRIKPRELATTREVHLAMR